jgi:hypothetical protein
LLGVGFGLGGLSAIHRCSKTIAIDGVKGGVNYDDNDRYCLDGQRLIGFALCFNLGIIRITILKGLSAFGFSCHYNSNSNSNSGNGLLGVGFGLGGGK